MIQSVNQEISQSDNRSGVAFKPLEEYSGKERNNKPEDLPPHFINLGFRVKSRSWSTIFFSAEEQGFLSLLPSPLIFINEKKDDHRCIDHMQRQGDGTIRQYNA
jgi:hypothetical protein